MIFEVLFLYFFPGPGQDHSDVVNFQLRDGFYFFKTVFFNVPEMDDQPLRFGEFRDQSPDQLLVIVVLNFLVRRLPGFGSFHHGVA